MPSTPGGNPGSPGGVSIENVYRPPAANVSAAPPNAAVPVYAGFWRRGTAYLLDSLILFIPSMIVSLVPVPGLNLLLQMAVWAVYKILMESSESQATLGKRAMGIKVTDVHGARISKLRATGRYFGSILSGLLLGIGLLMAAFTERRQALHDLMASTLVVNARASEDDVGSGAGGTMPLTAGVWVAMFVMFVFPFGIGILAAIAIPAYQDYTIRAKMMEVVHEAVQLKPQAASEIGLARSGGEAGVRAVQPVSKYVTDVAIDRGAGTIRVGVDTAVFGTTRIPKGAALILTLDSGGAQWTCAAQGIPNSYLPATCRS